MLTWLSIAVVSSFLENLGSILVSEHSRSRRAQAGELSDEELYPSRSQHAALGFIAIDRTGTGGIILRQGFEGQGG